MVLIYFTLIQCNRSMHKTLQFLKHLHAHSVHSSIYLW